MAEVIDESVKELIIHHVFETNVEDLAKTCISRSHSFPTLHWANGIVFYFEAMPPVMNEQVEEDYVNGRDHWAEVYYAKMDKYIPNMELGEGEFKGAKIRIVDSSNYIPHKDFVRWVKEDYNK